MQNVFDILNKYFEINMGCLKEFLNTTKIKTTNIFVNKM